MRKSIWITRRDLIRQGKDLPVRTGDSTWLSAVDFLCPQDCPVCACQADHAPHLAGTVNLHRSKGNIGQHSLYIMFSFFKISIDKTVITVYTVPIQKKQGRRFGECIHNGLTMNKEELYQRGINDSLTHVDFMIGTKDLSIEATLEDGSTLTVFKNGNFAF